MSVVKKSITLPKALDSYVLKRAKSVAKARGSSSPNFSAALADLIISARQQELSRAANADQQPEVKEAA